jgi:hypothetical protein
VCLNVKIKIKVKIKINVKIKTLFLTVLHYVALTVTWSERASATRNVAHVPIYDTCRLDARSLAWKLRTRRNFRTCYACFLSS